MGTWRPITTKPPTLLRISWFWVFFRWLFNVNGCAGNKKSTGVDQNYHHQKDLIVSYKKHFYHFPIRHILFSISSFLCWGYATSPLENLTFMSWFTAIFWLQNYEHFLPVLWQKLNFGQLMLLAWVTRTFLI